MTKIDSKFEKFRARHRLPLAFLPMAETYFVPLAHHLATVRCKQEPLIVGINGAQGTGKSTLADFLKVACESFHEWNVAVLSIDDFYLTKAERTQLASDVHPLLQTRGVPGTHDTKLLSAILEQLRRSARDDIVRIPRFDKASDDRADRARWSTIRGPVDLVILEGWCVASQAQHNDELATPLNRLEREQDVDGRWRRFVNDCLRTQYKAIFEQLNALIFLKAPSFESSFRWRCLQEQKLAATKGGDTSGLMTEIEIEHFMMHFERLTRANIDKLPSSADIVFDLNASHAVVACSHKP